MLPECEIKCSCCAKNHERVFVRLDFSLLFSTAVFFQLLTFVLAPLASSPPQRRPPSCSREHVSRRCRGNSLSFFGCWENQQGIVACYPNAAPRVISFAFCFEVFFFLLTFFFFRPVGQLLPKHINVTSRVTMLAQKECNRNVVGAASGMRVRKLSLFVRG